MRTHLWQCKSGAVTLFFVTTALHWHLVGSDSCRSLALPFERRTYYFGSYFCQNQRPVILLTSGEENMQLLAAASPTNFCTAQKLTSRVSKLSLKFNCFPSHLDIRPWKNTHCVTSLPLPGGWEGSPNGGWKDRGKKMNLPCCPEVKQ